MIPFFSFAGGNSLDRAPVGRVHDFVKVNGGHTVVTKVSITRMLAMV
jgi:acetyl-CoA carboxylase/biotin carboxylase 1